MKIWLFVSSGKNKVFVRQSRLSGVWDKAESRDRMSFGKWALYHI